MLGDEKMDALSQLEADQKKVVVQLTSKRPDLVELPWAKQLETISLTAAIDLSAFHNGYPLKETLQVSQDEVGSNPSFDWALRQTMRGLQDKKAMRIDRTSDYKTWALIYQLLRRCTLAKIARIITETHFMTVLESTFIWMRDRIAEDLDQSASLDDEDTEPYPSREKRDGQKDSASNIARNISTEGPELRTQREVLLAHVCVVVEQLLGLISAKQFSKDYAVEQLKYAIKLTPDTAATILGSAFYLMNGFTQSSNNDSRNAEGPGHKLVAMAVQQPCMRAPVDLWALSISSVLYTEPNLVHTAFMKHAIVPTLQMMHACTNTHSEDSESSNLYPTLRKLLVDHFALPYRQAFLEQEDVHDEETRSTPVIDDIVQGLKIRRLSRKLSRRTAERKTQCHLISTLLSVLFSAAAESSLRYSSQLRHAEDRWLNQLFRDIITVTDMLKHFDSKSRGRRSWKRLARFLLEACTMLSICLDIGTLQLVLNDFSGLFENKTDVVEWETIGYCLAVGSDVFVVGNKDEDGQQVDNAYLSALLTALTTQHSSVKEIRQKSLECALIPLLDAFTKARDLPGFIQRWEMQLFAAIELDGAASASGNSHVASLWEDERLYFEVSRHMESIDIGQTRPLLSSILDDLKATRSPGALIVVLDGICRGITVNETIAGLSDIALTLFEVLTTFIGEGTKRNEREWRVWRLLTTIMHRWLPYDYESRMAPQVPSLLTRALRLLKDVPEWDPKATGTSHDFRAQYHAFIFAFTLRQHSHVWANQGFNLEQNIEIAVNRVLRVMDKYCSTSDMDLFGKFSTPDMDTCEFVPGEKVTSTVGFYLGCVSYMISKPKLLGMFQESTQSRYIRQLYACALSMIRASKASSMTSINLARPWQDFLASLPHIEDATVHSTITALQKDAYLRVSEHFDSKTGSDSSKVAFPVGRSPDYQLAFSSLQSASLDQWTAGERQEISSRITVMLKKVSFFHFGQFTEHVVLLTALIRRRPEEAIYASQELNILLDIAEKGDQQNQVTRNSGSAIAQLTREVMSNVFLTSQPEKSSLYLQELMPRISRLLDRPYTDADIDEVAPKPGLSAIVVGEVFDVIRQNGPKFHTLINMTELEFTALRQMYLELLLSRMDTMIHPEQQSIGEHSSSCSHIILFSFDIRYLADLADLPRFRPVVSVPGGVRDQLKIAFNQVANSPWREIAPSLCLSSLLVGIAGVEFAIEQGHDDSIPTIIKMSKMLDKKQTASTANGSSQNTKELDAMSQSHPDVSIEAADDRHKLVQHIQRAVSALSWSQREDLVWEVEKAKNPEHREGLLHILRTIILSGSKSNDPAAQAVLNKVFTLLKALLTRHEAQFPSTMLALQCAGAFLSKQPRLVTQYQVDSIMALITTLRRHVSSTFSQSENARLFTALIRLFYTVLRTLRVRLSHRYHLILMALVSLLDYLIVPNYSTSSTTLTPSTTAKNTPISEITATHAADYARLLTLLCDPSPSAVSHKRKRDKASTHRAEHLSDETKRAKREAGARMIEWLQRFCALQLSGTIKPEVREALRPGVWAVMDVVHLEAERVAGLVERMSVGEREVYRGVWEEWKAVREGRKR